MLNTAALARGRSAPLRPPAFCVAFRPSSSSGIEKLKAQRQQITNRIARLRNAEPARERKRRTRRLILIGTYVESMWLKRRGKLTARQRERLDELLDPTGRSLKTAFAYRIKLGFEAFWDLPPRLAEVYLD